MKPAVGNAANGALQHAKNFTKNMTAMKTYEKVKFLSLTIIIMLIIVTGWYIHHQIQLYQNNCNALKKIYSSSPTLASLSGTDNPYLFRDYYIKTAYNCCSSGQFKNDWVGLCALKTCIQQGVRCLDFEIYSINNEPVVAVSSVNDFTIKQTYNYIKISEVFDMIMLRAFKNKYCPNPSDPLILHFRIMSKNVPMYNTLATQISSILNPKILGREYSFENNGENIGSDLISNFLGKIIIIADATNPLYQKTKLDEYINIGSGAPFMRIIHYEELKYTQDLNLKTFNKQNMSIVLPDWSANDTNPNFNIARQYGCQLIAMSFQNFDSNLEHYNQFFDEKQTAFVLKPKELRFIPKTIPIPPLSPPEYSYASRPIKSDFYDFKI
jgi:hypothetical protein